MTTSSFAGEPRPETSQQRACPGCGQPLEYDPAVGALRCAHCGTVAEFHTATGKLAELDYDAVLRELPPEEERPVVLQVRCENCGAEFDFPENVTAGRCDYCKSPICAGERSPRTIRPGAILPFALPEEKAHQAFENWLCQRWFLPGAVKREAGRRQLSGELLPFWLYSCHTVSHYVGQRGIYYYVTEHYTVRENGRTVRRTRQVRRTRWYPAGGVVEARFSKLLVPGITTLPESLLAELEPWYLGSLEEYRADCVRGFQEHCYDRGLRESFEAAKPLMEPEIERRIRGDIGGDAQIIDQQRTDYDQVRFRHLLLPVWRSSFVWRGREYCYFINARTGEVQGERPWSVLKIILAILGFAVLIAIGVLLTLE